MAFNDHSDTLSEPPLSPFSSRSLLSDGTQTSDEPADLGAFTSVFRVMSQMQVLQEPAVPDARPESREIVSVSENESDSSRWSHQIIDSYFENEERGGGGHGSPRFRSQEPTVGSDDDHEVDDDDENKQRYDTSSSDTEGMYENRLDDGVDGDVAPSLGAFDSTLGFLAAEFAKLAAAPEGRNGNPTGRSMDEPRRRRRRKRRGPSKTASVLDHDEAPSVTVVPTPEASSSSSAESSSPYKTGQSPPDSESGLPRPRDITSHRQHHSPRRSRSRPPQLLTSESSQPDLFISSSLPNPSRPLPNTNTAAVDPRLARLQLLTRKLRHHFPQKLDDLPENSWMDPRGPEVQPGDPLIHVFIDHSNILVGFLNHINHVKRSRKGAKPHLYFPALLLILERGRPISRRVVAASSPLYQSMDPAKELGYSVHVYARVPDISTDSANGIDNSALASPNETSTSGSSLALGLKNIRPKKILQSTITNSPVSPTNVLQKRSTNIDTDYLTPPFLDGRERERGRGQTHFRSSSHPTTSIHALTTPTSPTSTATIHSVTSLSSLLPPPRIRYREQGVDELLQLKLHQALLSPEADPLPPGSTIVLATGDGASGQFNEEGFLGAVKTALHKGWNVELYAWGQGISNVWWKVTEEEGGDRFKIWALDQYAQELLEAPSSSGS